jgi:hypothetical protein
VPRGWPGLGGSGLGALHRWACGAHATFDVFRAPRGAGCRTQSGRPVPWLTTKPPPPAALSHGPAPQSAELRPPVVHHFCGAARGLGHFGHSHMPFRSGRMRAPMTQPLHRQLQAARAPAPPLRVPAASPLCSVYNPPPFWNGCDPAWSERSIPVLPCAIVLLRTALPQPVSSCDCTHSCTAQEIPPVSIDCDPPSGSLRRLRPPAGSAA